MANEISKLITPDGVSHDIADAEARQDITDKVNRSGDTMTGSLKRTTALNPSGTSTSVYSLVNVVDVDDNTLFDWSVDKVNQKVRNTFRARRMVNNVYRDNYFTLLIDASGNPSIDISAPSAWRSALGLATVASSGDYDDLSNKPTIPAAQVQANWNETDTTDPSYIQNKPTIPVGSDYVQKAGDTMTGQLKTSTYSSVAMGSYGSSQNTIPNFCNEIRKSSGATGSVIIGTAFTKNNVTIATGWYNFIYSPHRSGGNNGQETGDNTSYGTLILNTMNTSYNDAATYILRVSNSVTNNYVEHVRKIIDSHLFKSGTYVANFSANTVHIAFANMGVSSRPSAVICTVQSLSNAFICYDFDASGTDITLHIQNNTNTSISGNVRFGYIVCP